MMPAHRLATIVVLLLATALPHAQAAAPQGSKTILSANSPWRLHLTWMTLQVKRKSGAVQYVSVRGRTRKSAVAFTPVKPEHSELPQAGWAASGFDDSSWARDRLPVFTRRTQRIGLICARGKFTVDTPAPLKLTLTCRGGAVVRVNGVEVGRADMPKGAVKFDTPAEAYPDEAYVSPKGSRLRWVGFGDPGAYKDRFAMRNRTLAVTIPASALKKGTNVLAVEVHRAPIGEIHFTARVVHNPKYATVDTCSIERLTLTAPAGAAVTPNVSLPDGVCVRARPAVSTVHTIDYADPHGKLKPVVLAGARNGAFSGQVVISSRKPLEKLSATMSDLKTAAGATIAATAVQIRWARADAGPETHVESYRGRPVTPYYRKGVRRFDGLESAPPPVVKPHPPAQDAVQPAWITVNVPKDAKPGDYAGTLTVAAGDAKLADVPVRLSVADWALPDTKDFVTFMGLVQSPDSVALRYKVPMWSEKHWELLDKSFALLGQLNSDDVYVVARSLTYFGNEHSMVRWIKKADPSTGSGQPALTPDLSIVERYIGLAVKHLGKVPVVVVYAWDVDSGSTYFGHERGHKYAHTMKKTGMPFTVLDPKTGKLTEQRGPKWGDPKVREFWKPVFDGVREILKKHGLEKSMMVGIASDKRPEKDAVADLAAAAPDAPWVIHSHPLTLSLRGRPVGYTSAVWGVYGPPHPSKQRCRGWQNPHIATVFPRYATAPTGEGLRVNSATVLYRIAMERCLTSLGSPRSKNNGLMRGIGRCGADFWYVLDAKYGRKKPLLGRYPDSSHWHGGWIHNSTPYVIAPGKDGPIATVRFEMLREGIQETECRIWLEKILTEPARKAKLGAELAARCQRLLDDRVIAQLRAMSAAAAHLPLKWYEGSGVTAATAKLYAVAAEVAGKLNAK
jgi:glycosyl hydrolase family 123